MSAAFYRGVSLLLMFLMLFSIQPAAFGEEAEEIGLVEESGALSETMDGEERTGDTLLLDEKESPSPVIVVWQGEPEADTEFWFSDTETFMTAQGELPGDAPCFTRHALLLSDRIGLVFCLHIPEGYRADGFVSFEGAGEEQACELPAVPDKNGDYRVICWLSPLQMACAVTPVFSSGELLLRGDAYSVRTFIEEHEGEEALRELLHALGNYGHFAELCYRGTEPSMPLYGDPSYDYEQIREELADFEIQWTPVGLVERVRPVFRVDPDSRLSISMKMINGYPLLPELSLYGRRITADADACYELASVTLTGLGTMLDAVVTHGGQSAPLRVSALSMACEVLDPEGAYSLEQMDFCAALYSLFEAVTAYRSES